MRNASRVVPIVCILLPRGAGKKDRRDGGTVAATSDSAVPTQEPAP